MKYVDIPPVGKAVGIAVVAVLGDVSDPSLDSGSSGIVSSLENIGVNFAVGAASAAPDEGKTRGVPCYVGARTCSA